MNVHAIAQAIDDVVTAARPVVAYDGHDLGGCPYLARYHGVDGADPNGICNRGCYDEPECVTCEPDDGWPILRLRVALAAVDAVFGAPRPAGEPTPATGELRPTPQFALWLGELTTGDR